MKPVNDYTCYNVTMWNKTGFRRTYELLFFSLEFLEEEFDYILFLKFDTPMGIFNMSLNSLIDHLNKLLEIKDFFVVLTPKKEAPLLKESPDEFVYSFACDFRDFKNNIVEYKNRVLNSQNLLFIVLDKILLGKTNFNKISVEQLPVSNIEGIMDHRNTYDVIIPHACDDKYLGGLLYFLKDIKGIDILVGLDQLPTPLIYQLKETFLQTSFYCFKPNPVGPYIIRNRLIDFSKNKIIFFQDSDDISCCNRFSIISDHMTNEDCQLCGSHELKLDYFNGTVRAIRYPLDVTAALKSGPGHSLLHPASAIFRDAFFTSGRLSEDRKFANDTKFLYNSFFKLNRIQNVDEFLYIRRIRPNSLTSSDETRINSPIRYELLMKWIREFDRVKHDIIKLENSDLIFKPTILSYNVTKF